MNNEKKFEIVKEEESTFIKATITDINGNKIITMQKLDEDNISIELASLREKVRARAGEISTAVSQMNEQLNKAKKDLTEAEDDISSLNELLNNI
jgi:hypothetical protein